MNYTPETQQLLAALKAWSKRGIEAALNQSELVKQLEIKDDVDQDGILVFCARELNWSHWTTTTRLTVATFLLEPLGLSFLLDATFSEFRVLYRAALHSKRLAKNSKPSLENARAAVLAFCHMNREQAEMQHEKFKNAIDGSVWLEPNERTPVVLGNADTAVASSVTAGVLRLQAVTGNSREQTLERLGEMLEHFDELTLQALMTAAERGITDLAGVVNVAYELLNVQLTTGQTRQVMLHS
jgi:hypothetical protein